MITQNDIRIDILSSFGFPEFIVGDKMKITRIFYNLLTNALKFARPHTHITVSIAREDDSWRLTVTDQGKGMSSNQVKHAFEPFVTERSARNPEGVGLGLYVTRQLAALMNATITVQSKPGKGATFRVLFGLPTQLAI